MGRKIGRFKSPVSLLFVNGSLDSRVHIILTGKQKKI